MYQKTMKLIFLKELTLNIIHLFLRLGYEGNEKG